MNWRRLFRLIAALFLLILIIVNYSYFVTTASAYKSIINQGKILNIQNKLTSSELSNYKVYLPLVYSYTYIPEIDFPGCRWPFNPGGLLYIRYAWGDRLQTSGTLWRIAFENGLSTWNMTSTPIWFYFDVISENIINTYYDETAANRGYTEITCNINGYTQKVKVLGNVYWDIAEGYTDEQRRGIATHEVGHGISIGHIPNSFPIQSLMYKVTPLIFFSTIYVPQSPDISLVNQIYP